MKVLYYHNLCHDFRQNVKRKCHKFIKFTAVKTEPNIYHGVLGHTTTYHVHKSLEEIYTYAINKYNSPSLCQTLSNQEKHSRKLDTFF